MSDFIIPNNFHQFSSEETPKLESFYWQQKGVLPSRRALKMASDELGIPQSRIKKWFAMQAVRGGPAAVAPVADGLPGTRPAKLNFGGCQAAESDDELDDILRSFHETLLDVANSNKRISESLAKMAQVPEG